MQEVLDNSAAPQNGETDLLWFFLTISTATLVASVTRTWL
jgi:hypothetical protein